jgi:hypothetical protein
MAETTTNLGKKTVLTTIGDTTPRIVLTDGNGAVNSITGTNLRTYMWNGITPDMIYDNILIAYCEESAYLRMVHLKYWPALQTSGKVACGVVVTEGDKLLVVAPTEATLKWSSAAVTGGGTLTTDRTAAVADWSGKANTAAQIKHSECSGTDYAPGFCANYSRLNSSGHGIGVGQWWLPSSGEANMIYNHISGINYALSLITDAVQIPYSTHWASTEYSANGAWIQHFDTTLGHLSNYYKYDTTYHVRPVSAYNAV